MTVDKTVCARCREPLAAHAKHDYFRCPGEKFATYYALFNEDGTIDTEYQDVPRCPHCGHDHMDVGDWVRQLPFGKPFCNDGDETEATCDRCGQPFVTTLHVSHDFTTCKRGE